MRTQFICPDGEKINIDQCLKTGGCRMSERCMTRSMLQQVAEQREWSGIPSVTLLIKGTLEAFLSIKNDYAESPDELMFSLLGTTVHSKVEQNDDVAMAEIAVDYNGITGIIDLVEEESGSIALYDYKVVGSYKVMLALGMHYELVETDEVYKRSTKVRDYDGKYHQRFAGDKKLVRKWISDLSKQDCFDWIMQVNYYRMAYENIYQKKIDKLYVQAIVRDGGLVIARDRGIFKKSYKIPLPILNDDGVLFYFNDKKTKLLDALNTGVIPDKCNDIETWEGRKCKDYCPVREVCPYAN